MRIMVVEDEPTSLKLATVVLSAGGHNVSLAKSAEEALVHLRKDVADVLLLDIRLPGMDGLSFVRLLREDPDLKAIPVVAITGYPDQCSKEDAMRAGCDAYIIKPVDTRRLSTQLADVSRKKA
jgi:CheY-like chemotaxis protein